jgi:glyoxylase-like metal-dependent hydrolase (beta-lactamase superfamily II)
MNLIAAGDGPQLMPDIFHTDASQARESLSRLAALDANVALPGHGDPMHGPISEHVATVLSR